MTFFKKLVVMILSGALLGDIAAMLIAPMVLAWYETPGDNGALCNCLVTVKSTTAHFIKAQAIGALGGAAVFLIIGLFVFRRSKSGASTASPSATGA